VSVFSGEGRGYGGGLSTEFGVREAGRRAATVGLIFESWAVLRRWLYSPMNGLAVSSAGSRISCRGGGPVAS